MIEMQQWYGIRVRRVAQYLHKGEVEVSNKNFHFSELTVAPTEDNFGASNITSITSVNNFDLP